MGYYNILGIDEKASQEDIRKAYHRLALRYHPDKQQVLAERRAAKGIMILSDDLQQAQKTEMSSFDVTDHEQHQQSSSSSNSRFVAIREAFAVLSCPEERERYDAELRRGRLSGSVKAMTNPLAIVAAVRESSWKLFSCLGLWRKDKRRRDSGL